MEQQSKKDTSKLGSVQEMVYHSLIEHKSWSMGCGWLWDTWSRTRKIMESLVRRGFAEKKIDERGEVRYYPVFE